MDDRQKMRVECHLAVSVGATGTERVRGWVRNLSAGGMFVQTEGSLPVGTRCEVAMLLRDGEEKRVTHALAEVVRAEADGLAVQFLDITPGAHEAVRRVLAQTPAVPG